MLCSVFGMKKNRCVNYNALLIAALSTTDECNAQTDRQTDSSTDSGPWRTTRRKRCTVKPFDIAAASQCFVIMSAVAVLANARYPRSRTTVGAAQQLLMDCLLHLQLPALLFAHSE